MASTGEDRFPEPVFEFDDSEELHALLVERFADRPTALLHRSALCGDLDALHALASPPISADPNSPLLPRSSMASLASAMEKGFPGSPSEWVSPAEEAAQDEAERVLEGLGWDASGYRTGARAGGRQASSASSFSSRGSSLGSMASSSSASSASSSSASSSSVSSSSSASSAATLSAVLASGAGAEPPMRSRAELYTMVRREGAGKGYFAVPQDKRGPTFAEYNELWPHGTGQPETNLDALSFTALHCAARSGDAEAATALIFLGADRDAESFCGVTPLLLAVDTDKVSVVRAVATSENVNPAPWVEALDVNDPRRMDLWPMYRALARQYAERDGAVVEALLELGAAIPGEAVERLAYLGVNKDTAKRIRDAYKAAVDLAKKREKDAHKDGGKYKDL